MKTRFAFNAHAKANDRAFWPSKMSVKLAIWLRGFFLISNDPTCNKINRKNLHFLGVNYVPSEHSGLGVLKEIVHLPIKVLFLTSLTTITDSSRQCLSFVQYKFLGSKGENFFTEFS
jgi:hypothetical protein